MDEAEKVGRAKLAEDSNDAYLRGALAWVYYKRIKMLVTPLKIKKERIESIDSRTAHLIERYLRDYARTKPKLLDLCHSQILRLLGHIGRHIHAYGGFVKWGKELL